VSPRVSVVTTVYNGELYVDRAIPGILAQTFMDFEWIIVNDGSTDGTREILEEVAGREPRVRGLLSGTPGYHPRRELRSRPGARRVYRAAGFDDRSCPERLRLQVELLDARSDVGVVGGYFVLVDENRNERYVRMPPVEHAAIVSALARSIVYANTTVMFRRVVWSQAGGYAEVDDLEDQLLWLAAAKRGWRFGTVPEVLGDHFVHRASFFTEISDTRAGSGIWREFRPGSFGSWDSPGGCISLPSGATSTPTHRWASSACCAARWPECRSATSEGCAGGHR
jgi:glycosyltransferase EpsE